MKMNKEISTEVLLIAGIMRHTGLRIDDLCLDKKIVHMAINTKKGRVRNKYFKKISNGKKLSRSRGYLRRPSSYYWKRPKLMRRLHDRAVEQLMNR